jgi:hypothetical protein
MSHDKAKRGPYANHRVNPYEPNEVKYWCQKFACTDMQLKNAVRAVGTSSDAVRDFLKGKKQVVYVSEQAGKGESLG